MAKFFSNKVFPIKVPSPNPCFETYISLTDLIFLLDTNDSVTKNNVRGILELSKSFLKRQVSIRYLHASDIELSDSTISGTSSNTSHSSHILNVTSIDSLVRSEKDNSTTTEVEDLSTKSAFFVISDTELIQEVIANVRTVSYTHLTLPTNREV